MTHEPNISLIEGALQLIRNELGKGKKKKKKVDREVAKVLAKREARIPKRK